MTEYYIGQIISENEDYPNAVDWCIEQSILQQKDITINEIAPLNGERRFQIVDLTPTEEEQAQARELAFNESFFNTSLGYIRRKVTMKDGSTKDFLTDILPLLQVDVPIISYDKPNFTVDEMPKQNTDKLVTEEFINECKQQVLKDFYGAAGS